MILKAITLLLVAFSGLGMIFYQSYTSEDSSPKAPVSSTKLTSNDFFVGAGTPTDDVHERRLGGDT